MGSIISLIPAKTVIIFPLKSPSVSSINCFISTSHVLHFVLLFYDVLIILGSVYIIISFESLCYPDYGSCLLKPASSSCWGGRWGWALIWPSECGEALCFWVSSASQDAALPPVPKGFPSLCYPLHGTKWEVVKGRTISLFLLECTGLTGVHPKFMLAQNLWLWPCLEVGSQQM